MPGACDKLANRKNPLCYCNNGMYHVDWDHNISVDSKNACANCGTKPEEPEFMPEDTQDDFRFAPTTATFRAEEEEPEVSEEETSEEAEESEP